MTTFKNVFNEYINEDEIYEHVVQSKKPRLALKPIVSVCMIFLICIVGHNIMNEKKSTMIKDENNQIIINNLSDNYVINEDYLLVLANPSISNQKEFYEKNPFINQLEKDYNWEVYYARLPNADDLKDHTNQNSKPLYTIFRFVDNEKEIEIKITDKDVSNKFNDFESSIIDSESVVIYKNVYNYHALYGKDGLNYEIKSTNLSENEFIKTLKLIIKE